MTKKHTINVWMHKYYYLGTSKDGIKYYLKEFLFDCDWYWGGGYITTFTNNRQPSRSKDIMTHEHFDTKILKQGAYATKTFKDLFPDNPYTTDEIWTICELMNSFYVARKYSDMLYTGNANYTNNPAKNAIQNDAEYERINKKVIPEIAKELYKIME